MSVASSIGGIATMAARHALASLRPPRAIEKIDAIETLRAVVDSGVSLARFGDGELHYALQGKRLDFQPRHRRLAERLQRALFESHNNVLTCFNHYAAASSRLQLLTAYPRYATERDKIGSTLSTADIVVAYRGGARRAYERYWRIILTESDQARYGEASVFFLQIYVQEYLRGEMETVFALLRRLFLGRRILFVAPVRPLGGPSFRELEPVMRFLGMVSADYIDIPSIDAFASIGEIEAAIRARRGYDDIFIQAGPVATVLASELSGTVDGRVLDVGSFNTQVPLLL